MRPLIALIFRQRDPDRVSPAHVTSYRPPSTVFTTVTRSPSSTWPFTVWFVDGPVRRRMSSQRGVIAVAPNVLEDVRKSRIAAEAIAAISALDQRRRGGRLRTQPGRTGSSGWRAAP